MVNRVFQKLFEQAEIARNLKSMNLPTANIAKATGLTTKEIDKL